ncbi:DNA (cytosine-5)-methyltransferase 1 [Chitinophaga sp. YR573]|uniref:DNA cytosine methyltransferase n=1 Tax=Chitinophaga sp. YR573 TaxID=1881040 RepID=UPI0008D6B7C3|nr:DNA cytosine methyltransferase [Chitinophaga sp. YR573]SEV88626.1 DNA (cytosine-5)-methyltransferase 1 [Chitinophaga sp. YR573]
MRKVYFIDLFCGAGGVTTGIDRARYKGMEFAKVIACFNHDPMAIASHESNHPDTIHFLENILTADLTNVREIVERLRREDPYCLIFIWASLECTNFSKAKGGLPRDGDSRTLADGLFRYLDELNPDGLWIENVEEFMSWGPLDDNGKPISKKSGQDYLRWVNEVKTYGYEFEYRILNAADYGAYTSRKRYFAQFMRPELPIVWPEASHAKKPAGGCFGTLEKWKAVKDVLDFNDEGDSIFTRKKPLSDKTMERIYAGLLKYVAGGKQAFIAKYYSGKPDGKVISIDGPAGTVRCKDGQSLITSCFIAKYYSNGGQLNGVDEPASTISTKDRLSLIQPKYWIDKNYSGKYNHQSVEQPAGTIVTNDKHSVMQAFLMGTSYNNNPTSLDVPAPTITASHHASYLINPSWGGHTTSTNQPCPVIVARQDKAPMYMLIAVLGKVENKLIIGRSVIEVKIRYFMAAYGIINIKMRMLKIPELLRIQGFGDGYILKGTEADKKKFIGNAVEVNQAKVLIEASYAGIVNSINIKTA